MNLFQLIEFTADVVTVVGFILGMTYIVPVIITAWRDFLNNGREKSKGKRPPGG